VLGDFHLLDLFAEGGTVSDTVFAGHANLLRALGHVVEFLLIELLGWVVKVSAGQSVVVLLKSERCWSLRVNRQTKEVSLCVLVCVRRVRLGLCLALVSSH